MASSCGRLFDAVAAAVGLHRDRISFEGQAAMALESRVTERALAQARAGERYPVAAPRLGGHGLPYVEPVGMWRAILGDLGAGVPIDLIASRFHVALADAIGLVVDRISAHHPEIDTVALSGGCWQNRVLFELVLHDLSSRGLTVLSHRLVPANDGCIALGQAAIAAAVAGGEP